MRTEGKWTVLHYREWEDEIVCCIGELRIARIATMDEHLPESDYNAQFICKAANNHDELLEAVKVALWNEEHDEYQAQHQEHPRMIERLAIYRAVLKKVNDGLDVSPEES